MAPVTNGRALFNAIPTGYPDENTIRYDTSETIDLENVPLNGGFLLKTLELSIDPYMRGRMRDPKITRAYSPPFLVGKPMIGHGVSVVLRSEFPGVKPGDHIYSITPHAQYNIFSDLEGARIIENKEKLPWSVYVGAAGMAGQTAYMAWKEFSHAKKGEIVFVTTGGGPVGSFVIQLAKQQGLKVIASAGSEDKVNFMKEVGADVAFNYKTTSTKDILLKEGPIDIYWDNVGGETLEIALDNATSGARFIECGMITAYNTGGGQPIKNLFQVIAKCISMNGFLVPVLHPKYKDEFYRVVPPLLASGQIKYREHIFNGLDKVGDGIIAVLKGTNTAKAVIHVVDE